MFSHSILQTTVHTANIITVYDTEKQVLRGMLLKNYWWIIRSFYSQIITNTFILNCYFSDYLLFYHCEVFMKLILVQHECKRTKSNIYKESIDMKTSFNYTIGYSPCLEYRCDKGQAGLSVRAAFPYVFA